MKRFGKKSAVVVVAVLIIVGWYTARIDGRLRPVEPVRVIELRDTASSYVRPTLARAVDDEASVYAVLAPRPDGLFQAIRVDIQSGQQSPAAIPLGPRSRFIPFVDGNVRVDVRGLSIRRPTFHLFTFPDGRGPGFHFVDSDTGLVVLSTREKSRQRTLITRWVFNSSTVGELASLASMDPSGRFVAVVAKTPAGWKLFLFNEGASARSSSLKIMEKS